MFLHFYGKSNASVLVLAQYIDIPIYWSSYLLDTYIDTAR